MNQYDKLRQRVGLINPTQLHRDRDDKIYDYKDRNYEPYDPDEEERKRKEEEREAQRKEQEERYNQIMTKRQQDKLNIEKLESKVDAVKSIGKEQAETLQPPSPIDNIEFDDRYKSHRYRESAISRINKQFGEDLANDIEQTVQYKRGLGMTDAQIQEQFIPIEDRPLDKLAEIEKKLKKGEEKGFYKVQEGFYQYEVMNVMSNEANKAMNGLPNRLDEVNRWIADHPELEMEESEFEAILAPGLINNPTGIKSRSLQEADNLMGDSTKPIQGFKLKEGVGVPIDSAVRFMGSMAQLGYASAKDAAKDPMTWATIGLMMATSGASSALLASKGATAAKFVNVPLVNKTAQLAKNLTTMQQFRYGMNVGRAKYMMDLEAGSAYNEYIQSGVHPEIAKEIAKTVGVMNGIIEYAQFGQLTRALPGVKTFAKATEKVAQAELRDGLMAMGKAWGIDVLQNVGEEVMQESNTTLGLALSQYMTEAPNPNTVEGLKVLAKTMSSDEYRERMAATAIESALSVWLMPLASSAGSFAANRTITQLEQSAAKKAANGWYTEEEKQTKAYQDEAKKVLPYTVEVLAKDAVDNKSEDSVKGLTAVVTILEEVEKRPDLSNEDKAKISETKQKANEALAKVEYDVKSENPDIELATTNKQEIEQKVLSGELPRINPNLTEVNLELRQKAQDKGIYTIIYNGLLEGKRKSEISAEVEKLLPRKERNAIEIMQYINAVEIVEQEIKMQFNAAKIANLMSVKDSLKTKAPEQPTTNETEVSQPTDSLDEENATTVTVEPEKGNDTVAPIPKEPLEVVEGKYEPTDAVKVPVKDIQLDPKRFQFRFNGTTNRMEGIAWNDKLAGTILLWENEYGDLYVVNGHHRVMAAKENNVKTLDAKILRGITAEQARAEGAILNIAEGSADAIDTAKFLRDTNSTLDDLTKLGVPPKSKIARDGANLAKLEDGLFYMAATKQIPYERAVMIGRELGDDKVAQRQFYDMMVKEEAKRGYLKDSTIDAMLNQVKAVGAVEYFQESLLGADDTRSAVVERAELVAYVKDNLKNKKNVLKKINKTKNAKMLEQLGNKIKVDDNVKEMELADQALYLLDKTVNAKDSKVSQMFNDLAIDYAKTGDKKVLDKALKMVGDLMESGELLQEAFGKDKAKTDLIDALEEQLDGQADLFGMAQIKEMPSIKVKVKQGTNEETHARLMPLIEIMEKNPIFNGLEIVFTGQESTRFMDRSELDAKGYRNYKPGYYTEYGSFRSLPGAYIDTRAKGDNAERTNQGDSTGDSIRNNEYTPKTGYTRGNISLTNSAQVDTLLHEAIHSIQDILERVDPEFSVLVKAWENEIFELAKEQGIELPQGKEMLAHALMLGEFGYANDSFELAKAVEVPTEIIDRFKDMLGKQFVKEAMGTNKADSNRKLKADYKKIADINLQSTEIAQSIAQARNRRLNKIKMDLRAGEPIRYYSADTTTYAIAIPKDTDYEVSFFNEQGLLTKAVLDINKLAKKLSDMKMYYNPWEISYQLKQFNRDQIDSLVMGKAIDSPMEIVRAFENARIGNFTASDYDNYVKDMLNEADKQDLLKAIMNAAEKGLDKPNAEVTIQEYVNRFYPQRIEPNDYGMRERNRKIEFIYKAYNEMNPHRSNETVPIKIISTHKTAAEAIESYRKWLNLDRSIDEYKALKFETDFAYMLDYWDQLLKEYEDFRDNVETFRSDYSTEFTGEPKYNISYQLKSLLISSKRIDPTKGETLKVAYKGFREGETRRISTGNQEWDSLFFIADNYNDASLYGENVEIYDVSPKAKILYEGTKDFSDIAKSSKRNETMLEWASRIAIKAKEQGYDAVWFKRQGEIGTAVINREILNIPDNLRNYQLKAAINTEEFKTFFGKSAVADQDGKPLVAYHGSYDARFDSFDINFTNPYSLFGKGFYFTLDKGIAEEYANQPRSNNYGVKKVLPKGASEWKAEDLINIRDAASKVFNEMMSKYNAKDTEDGYLKFAMKAPGAYAVFNDMRRLHRDIVAEHDLSDATEERYFRQYEKDPKYMAFRVGDKGYALEWRPFNDFIATGKDALELFAEKGIEFDIDMEVPGVYETYLSIQKPFDADGLMPVEVAKAIDKSLSLDMGEIGLETWAEILTEDFADDPDRFYAEHPSQTPFSLSNVLFALQKMGGGEKNLAVQARRVLYDVLQELGYDGITHMGGRHIGSRDHRVYIAFKPTQIKSIYNNGNFSLYDPNINYQLKSAEDGITQYSLGNINNFVEAEENKTVVYSDTVDLFNNKVLSVKGDITDRLMPFIKYDAVMGGYDSIKLNDGEPVLITNEEILEVMEKGQPLFQIKELVAVHNLSEGQLKSTVKLGGIVMPSIAVTLKNYLHDRYGEISLLFNKNTIDPRANKDNRVYSGDAYTPEFPSIKYKINDQEARTLRDRVKSALAGTQYMNEYRDTIDATNIEDRVNREGSFEGAYKYDPLLMLTYLKEKGIDFEPVMRTKNYEFDVPLMEQLQAIEGEYINKRYLESSDIEQLEPKFREAINKFYGVNLYSEEIGYGRMDRIHSNIIEFSKDATRETIDGRATETKLQETIDHADYTKWFNEVSKNIVEAEGIRNNRDLFNNAGNRRSWNALHDPVTLDNLLRAMKSENEKTSGWWGGIGEFGAAASNTFKSIKEIKADSYRLRTMDEAEYQAIKDDFANRLSDLAHRAAVSSSESNPFIASNNAMTAMVDAVGTSKTKEGIKRVLAEYGGLTFTDEMVDEVIALAQEVAQMPTEYFEAKPRRIVGLEEIQAVIMPIDTDPELIQMLRDRGIHLIEFYDKSIEGDRQRAMDEALGKNDVSFQIKPTPTDTEAFRKYFKDSKAVNENGKPLMLYHGTKRGGFSEFIEGFGNGYKSGIFFTDRIELAKTYAGTDKILDPIYPPKTLDEAKALVGQYGGNIVEVYDYKGHEFESVEELLDEYGDVAYNTYFDLQDDYGQSIHYARNEKELLKHLVGNLLDVELIELQEGIYPVYLSLQNPLIINGQGSNWDRIVIPDWFSDEDGNPIPSDPMSTNEIVREAKGMGYDGVIFKDISDSGAYGYGGEMGDVYVAFSPTQIKSVYNRGTWDATNADMYYQIKGEPQMEERSWSQTVRDANLTQDWLRDMLTDRKMMYEVAHNEDSMIAGAKLIDERGIEYIEARLDNDFEATPDVMAAGMILIYYYQESGDRPSTHDMVAKVAKKATTAGQAIQILSYLNRESPEGILRFTRKEFDKQSTSRQRKTLDELTKKVEEEVKKVNSETVDTVDVEGLVKKVQDMTQEELDTLEIAQDDQKTQDFMEGKEVETNQKSTVEPEVIAQVIKDHYKGDGKRSLVSRLRNAGMNPTEAKLLSDSIEAEMLNATDAKVQEILDRLATGKAKAVDKSIKTLISQGRYGEALKLKLGQKKGVPVLTDEMADMVYQRAEEISKMPEGREKNVQLALLLRDIDAEMPVGLAGKITTFRIMMMLLNPVTMLRNILGNLGFGAVDTFALNVVGSQIDKLYAKNSGFRTTLNRGTDVLRKQWQGYGTGGKVAYEDAKLGIDTNRDVSRMELGKTGRTFARGTVLGWFETALNIGLRVPDAAAIYATSLDTITEQIEIAGVAEPTQEMIDIAHNLGLYRTFNDDSLMSEAFKTIKNGLNIVGTKSIKYAQKKGYSDNAKWTALFGADPTRGSFGFGDIVLPFTKTVANITQRAIDYSPAGVILTMAKLYLDHSQSDYVRQRMKVEAIARGITGTALVGTGMLLAQLGVIRGGDPEDEDKDVLELQEQAGLRPYTINLSAISRLLRGEKNAGDLRPGDQLATYDWLQPGALTIAIGADIVAGDGDTFNLINTLVRAMEVGSETVTGQPLLQNITRIFEWGINRGLTNTLKSLPASFIPSVLGRVAQAADGGATDPYSYFSEGRQAWNLIANKLVGDLEVNGVPLGRGAIPDKIDIMGEPIKWYGTDNQFTKYLQALTSPAIMTDYTPTEEMQFLIDLTRRTGDSTIIQMPQRTFSEKGVSYEPTPEQFEAMSIYYGKALQQDIKSLMQYGKGRDDEWLAKEVANIVRDIKGEIKFKFIRGDFN